MEKRLITLSVNKEIFEVAVKPNDTLLEVLREKCDLVGAKEGCGLGECGACTVLRDGRPILSCLSLAVDAAGSEITTIEGLAEGDVLHPLQQSFIDHGAVQCGYCTPGMILTAGELLDRQPCPDEADIREAVSGNLCRCTGYAKIVEAVKAASKVTES